MTYVVGPVSLVSQTSDPVNGAVVTLSSVAASGGTGPYNYQYYFSTVTGFSPGAGNIAAGATSLVSALSGLIPGTQYYAKIRATDTGLSNTTVDSAQFAFVSIAPQLSQNQFSETSLLGVLDQHLDFNTISVQIDPSQATPLSFGAAVKMVDSATGGAPSVVACSADSDNVLGFINFNLKTILFTAGNMCEISIGGNVIYLYATAAIARGAQVCLDLTTNGGVQPSTTGNNIVGWAYDKATAPGQLIRVYLKTPSFLTAS